MQNECLGHSKADDMIAYHGDPSREHKLWVYPIKDSLITLRWDYRVNPCTNSKRIDSNFWTGWAEY